MQLKKWWKESVVYQIYPRSFMDSDGDGIGDLKGITGKLDYLSELGVDVLWLSPIFKSPNVDNGYDISNYQDIMDDFGSLADFDELLTEAHQRNLKIMLDLVVNHTSDQHQWFVESCKSKNNSYRDYYIWKDPKDGVEPNNWGSSFGSGSAWQLDEATGMYYLHLFAKQQPDLNWANPTLRKEIYNMMTWWLDKGIDGFRMDVINLIAKDDAYPDGPVSTHSYTDFYPCVANHPKTHEYLKEMNHQVLSKYDIITVGEMPLATIAHAQKYTGEDENELNMIFHFEHMALDSGEHGRWSDNKMNLLDLKEVMTKWQLGLEQKGWNSLYWNNHDQPRIVSRFGDDMAYRKESSKMLGTCLHFMHGTPYIFQGEELGMTNVKFNNLSDYRDIDTLNTYYQYVEVEGMPSEEMMGYIHKKSRDNARTPMQWDDTANAGFTVGTPWIQVNPNYTEINAKQELSDSDSIFHYYKKLIQLRKKYPVVVYGVYELLEKDCKELFVYTRSLESEKILVVCNFTALNQNFSLPEEFRLCSEIILDNYYCTDQCILKPYEARVYYKNIES